MSTTREVKNVIDSHRQLEGAGFEVRRPFPSMGIEQVDPFLLLDEMGPVDYRPGAATGAPDHPHRGFETVSYILEGEVEHEDSAGHKGTIRPHGVQWMTAGAGIVHSEEPSEKLRREGGRMHGFQIWVNLPKALKMTQPRYQELTAAELPTAQTKDGKAHVRVIAGEALGAKAKIDTHIPIVYQDWTLQPGGEATVQVSADQRAMVYVFGGEVLVGEQRTAVKDGQLAVLGQGDAVTLRGSSSTARLLLLAGRPLNEPLARYGPFVMNERAELLQAFADYESGKMGDITRTARHG